MKNFTSHSLEETKQIATSWLAQFTDKQSGLEEAPVIALSGHLGAGKTAFVKEIARELGITEEITSPTFVIMKIYETKHPRWHRLVHIDAYRLERGEELEVLGWERLVADPYNLIMFEWPENTGLTPEMKTATISFEIRDGLHHISFLDFNNSSR